MFRRALVVFSLSLWAPASSAQEPARAALEPIDLFRLDYLMVAGAEDPQAWLDAERYLVFDAGPRTMPGQGTPTWSAVTARTGKRERYVDRRALGKSLQDVLGSEVLGSADGLDAALGDAAAWTWNATHTQFVVNVQQDLFLGTREGTVRRLTATPKTVEEGVQVSPDGAFVSFVADYNLHLAPVAGGDVRALTKEGHSDLFFGRLDWVYQEELYGRGNFQGYWWSPDSKHIALLKLDESPVEEFVLVRESPARPAVEKTNYPKTGEPNPIVEIGAISIADGSVRWFDTTAYPATDRLVVRVTWAPDGKEVLFQVQNREQTWLDMLAGDPQAGTVRKLWREDSDCWVEAGPEPVWLAGGASFLWLSERDGFRHLYHFARDGKLLGRLTEGAWQVKKVVGTDEAKGVVYATTDRASPLQTHLEAVPLAGGEPRRLTAGDGTHDVTMAPDHATFVTRWSNVKTPPCVFLRDLEDAELRVIARPNTKLLRNHDLAEPHFVQVPTRDGFPMEAMVLKPAGFTEGKQYPVLQHTYSGPHAPRVRDEWGGRDFLWHQLLTQQGYVVFTCDNRSASGKGRKYAKACWRKLGQSELPDLEDAVDWLVQQGYADPARFAIWGWSYGGYQTLFNLTHSTKWKAGIAVNPVTDWRNYDTIYTERYGGLPKDQEGYEAGSCVAAAGNLVGSLLLVCASMDDNVHMQNSLQFLAALQQAGKDCDFMVYPGVRHGIEDLQQQLHLFARFRRFLRGEAVMASVYAGPLSRFYAQGGGDAAKLRVGVEAWRADLCASVAPKVAAQLVWDEGATDATVWELGDAGWLALRLFAFYAERSDLEMPDTVPALLELDPDWRAAADGKFAKTLYGQLLACRVWLPGEFPVTLRAPLPDGETAEIGSLVVLMDQLRRLNQRTFQADQDQFAGWLALPAVAGGGLIDAARRGYAGLWGAVEAATRARVPVVVREV